MKRFLLFTAIMLIAIPCFSQDIISMKNGKRIEVIVTEVTPTLVRYKFFSEPQGRTYFVYKDDVSGIKYRDGRLESFTQSDEQKISSNSNANLNQQKNSNDKSKGKVETPKPLINNENQTERQQTANNDIKNSNQEINPIYVAPSQFNSQFIADKGGGNSFSSFVESGGLNVGYRGIVEVSYQYGVGDYGVDRIKLNLINGFQLNPYFSLGLGIGLRYYYEAKDALIPVFADIRLNALDKKVSPYLSIGVGYSFNATNDFEGVGLLFNPTVGISIKISDKSAVNVGVGYEMQKSYYTIYGGYDFYYHNWSFDSGAISFVVGISF